MSLIASEKKLLRVEEAAKALGIGRTRVFEQIKLGRLRSVKIGNSRLVPVVALDEFVALLMEESAQDRAA